MLVERLQKQVSQYNHQEEVFDQAVELFVEKASEFLEQVYTEGNWSRYAFCRDVVLCLSFIGINGDKPDFMIEEASCYLGDQSVEEFCHEVIKFASEEFMTLKNFIDKKGDKGLSFLYDNLEVPTRYVKFFLLSLQKHGFEVIIYDPYNGKGNKFDYQVWVSIPNIE